MKKRRKSDEKVAEKQQKTALFTAKMINEVEYNDFQTVKYCSVGAGTSFQGRWNVFIGINRRCVGSCKSGGSGGKVVIKPSFSPLLNYLIYR